VSAAVLCIVPAFNEEASVGPVVAQLRALGYDVCVVDDGSTDRTAAEAGAAGAQVLRLPRNVGVGGALRCGFRFAVAAGYAVVVQVDGDGQHDPAQVRSLLDELDRTGADMVVGTRFGDAGSSFALSRTRRLAMRLLARRASAAVGVPLTDATSGFRAIRRPLLERFADEYPTEYLGDTVEALVVAGRGGARVRELAVHMSARETGQASAGSLASVWYVVRVLLAIELMPRTARRPAARPDEHGGLP